MKSLKAKFKKNEVRTTSLCISTSEKVQWELDFFFQVNFIFKKKNHTIKYKIGLNGIHILLIVNLEI